MPPRWRFGVGQTAREELREIAEAQSAGLVDDYLQGQRWRDIIEAETERRRGRPCSWVVIDSASLREDARAL